MSTEKNKKKTTKKKRDYKRENKIYKSKPEQIKLRSARNKARRQAIKEGRAKVGDGTSVEHIKPLSKGGKNVWNNCITACKPCNWRKGDKVGPEWRPRYKPYTPGYYELVRKRKQLDFTIRHPSWYQWLDLDVKTS